MQTNTSIVQPGFIKGALPTLNVASTYHGNPENQDGKTKVPPSPPPLRVLWTWDQSVGLENLLSVKGEPCA